MFINNSRSVGFLVNVLVHSKYLTREGSGIIIYNTRLDFFCFFNLKVKAKTINVLDVKYKITIGLEIIKFRPFSE